MNICVYCGVLLNPPNVVCSRCAGVREEAKDLNNPTTVNFTKPTNPKEGKDPSLKQALELEQNSFIQNRDFLVAHPELLRPDVEGSKSGKQVLREFERKLAEYKNIREE